MYPYLNIRILELENGTIDLTEYNDDIESLFAPSVGVQKSSDT